MNVLLLLVFTFTVVSGYTKLSDDKLKQIPKKFPPGDYLKVDDKNGLLEPILKVRLPDTDNSTQVRDHFKSVFDELDDSWEVRMDQFYNDTPIKKNVSFTNFIATRDPPNAKPEEVGRLVLTAHYDSKLEPTGFIGAIDSAFPCAAILYAVKAIDQALTAKWEKEPDSKIGLQVVMFDGEEAFKEWTDTDSIYGSRHLASSMEAKVRPQHAHRETELDTIDTLLLLDLLGTADPSVPSYFRNTDWLHVNMGDVQKRVNEQKVGKTGKDFLPRPAQFSLGGRISDDHLPFLHRGVPILHLIPTPFPKEWHKMSDNADCLDPDTMHDWAVIVSVFTAEFMELDSYLEAPPKRRRTHIETL